MKQVIYPATLYPFRFRRLAADQVVAISEAGDHVFLDNSGLEQLIQRRDSLSLEQVAEFKSKFFIGADDGNSGSRRLLASRLAARHETVLSGPSLHIFVPTLQCAHTCRYCQVSRALEDVGHAMSLPQLDAACDTLFQSQAPALTVEFQGGDPLLRFDLVRYAIERIHEQNLQAQRQIRYVVTSTLHQLDEVMCTFFKQHKVYLSTSLDGPASLHDQNRPLPSRDSHARTLQGIALARQFLGPDAVSALVTVTRQSLEHPEDIVDEYVSRGFHEIFLRPLSRYGFAVRNAQTIDYDRSAFHQFYQRAFERILHWNRQGVPLREASASIVLNKILSPFDAGYVDLQTPSGAGLGVVVYNYDGYVYPSDEARMLAEMGDTGLRLGKIGESLSELLTSPVQRQLVAASLGRYVPGCNQCAYSTFCGPDPVNAYGQWGTMQAPVYLTDHCERQLWLFDFFFERLRTADRDFLELAHRWAGIGTGGCHA